MTNQKIGTYRYVIANDFSVSVWNDEQGENEAPIIFQPTHPSGAPFSSQDEAELWIVDILAPTEPIIEEGADA